MVLSAEQEAGESNLHIVLREEMCNRNWGVQQLADALGVKYTVASRWVAEEPSKRVIPHARTLIQIADVFGLGVVDVFKYAGLLPMNTDGRADPDEQQIQVIARRVARILRGVPAEHRKAAFILAATSLDSLQVLIERLNDLVS